jgi:hypothetical protein
MKTEEANRVRSGTLESSFSVSSVTSVAFRFRSFVSK